MTKHATRRPPWTKANPKKTASSSRKLTTSQKAAAKASARKAGRPTPTLSTTCESLQGRKRRGRRRNETHWDPHTPDARPPRRADCGRTRRVPPQRGGASETRRQKTGKPDVAAGNAPQGQLGPALLRAMGKLPALKTKDGKPTRFALSAAAWGEPVPQTVAAARRIAAKGRRLLAKYKKKRSRSSR